MKAKTSFFFLWPIMKGSSRYFRLPMGLDTPKVDEILCLVLGEVLLLKKKT